MKKEIKINKKHNFNKRYFDEINNSNKAYWLGFIWGDGYVGHRVRKSGEEYQLKIDLSSVDSNHLEKLKIDINSDYILKNYIYKTSYSKSSASTRFSIYNKHLGKLLIEKYGIFVGRVNIDKCIKNIEKKYHKDFIRGIVDADGSFSQYYLKKEGYSKYIFSITNSVSTLRFIENYFIKQGLINNKKRKLGQRHEESSTPIRSIKFSGRNQVKNILDFLYKDSTIYLDRKYEKYKNIMKNI